MGCYMFIGPYQPWQCTVHHTRTREKESMSSKPDYSKSPYRAPFIGRGTDGPKAAPVPFPSRVSEPQQDLPRAA